MNKIRLIVLPLMLLLAGCVTSRPLQFAPANLDQSTIYLFNNMGGLAFGSRAQVIVNGVPVVTLAPCQYTWFFVPPGMVEISVDDPLQLGRRIITRQFVVQRGRPYYICYQNVRYTNVELPDGKTYAPVPVRETTFRTKDLVWVRDSDGIALTETFRLVRNASPWGGVGGSFEQIRIAKEVGFVK